MKLLPITLLSLLTTTAIFGQNGESNPDFTNADCVTLLDSTNVQVAETGTGTFTIHKKFTIQTEAGAIANHVVKYDYDPLTAFAEFRYATIHRANGTTVCVDVTKAYDYAAPARAIYWGARQIMLDLGRLAPGDTIEYEISKKGFTYALLASDDESRFIPPMRGQFYDIVPFWVSEPTVRKVYRVSIPLTKDMQFQFYQGECTSSMRYGDGCKTYTSGHHLLYGCNLDRCRSHQEKSGDKKGQQRERGG